MRRCPCKAQVPSPRAKSRGVSIFEAWKRRMVQAGTSSCVSTARMVKRLYFGVPPNSTRMGGAFLLRGVLGHTNPRRMRAALAAAAGKLGWAEGREGRRMICMLLSIFLNGTQQRRFRDPIPSQALEEHLNCSHYRVLLPHGTKPRAGHSTNRAGRMRMRAYPCSIQKY